MNLIDIRLKHNTNQLEIANLLNIPVRTYRRYEKDENYGDLLKRKMMIETLLKHYEINETNGILTIEQIKEITTEVFDKKFKDSVNFCYLFGSYAKGCATESSDVDLYVVSSLEGFSFLGLMEELRISLHKNVDVIRQSELDNNIELTNEIMKWGIKIYG